MDAIQQHFTPQQRAQYEATMAERRAAYTQYFDTHPEVAKALAVWAEEMTAEHGRPICKMWYNRLPWAHALMVKRFGEAVEHWPDALTSDDLIVAYQWQQGKFGEGVTILPKPPSTGGIAIGLLLLLFAATQVGFWALLGLPFIIGAAMSDYLEGQVRAHIFRTATFTKPTGLTIHLYTAAPGDAGGGTEVSGGSYASVARDPLDANWTAASATDGLTDNAAAITYPAPTANWGQVTHFAIKDQAANFLFTGALTTPKTVNNGDPAPSFGVGALDITFA
jgi:hypothetical protein